MSHERAQAFIQALQDFEAGGDVQALARLFDEGCELSNVASPHLFTGRDGARRFWEMYRSTLHEVRSTFRNVIVSGDKVALEWTTQGTSYTGAPIHYEGVSVLEFDGERIRRFYAYFDPGLLGRELHEREQRAPA